MSKITITVSNQAVPKTKWTDGQRLDVFSTIMKDVGYSANVNILCPICKTNSLSYDRASIFDMTAWCDRCEAGLKQGKGARS